MAAEQAKQFIEQAMQSLQGGQMQQALELIEKAIEQDPNSSEANVLKGIALSQLSQPDAATEAFRRAILLSPYNVKAYYNLAVHYFAIGQKTAAEEMAREAVRTDPKHAGARDLLSRIEAEKRTMGSEVPTPEMLKEQARQGAAEGQPIGGEPSQAPPPAAGPTPGQPQQPPAVQVPVQSPYRTGYESKSTVHSIGFIENLGKNWNVAGYGIAIVSCVLGTVSLVQSIMMFSQAGSNFEQWIKTQQEASAAMGMGNMLLSLLILFVDLMSLLWMVMELSDRRGNWLWLLPFVLCCCCSYPGLLMLIYLWKGRE